MSRFYSQFLEEHRHEGTKKHAHGHGDEKRGGYHDSKSLAAAAHESADQVTRETAK